jgi:hypothetical protein
MAVGLMLLKVNWWRWLLLARPDALGTFLLFSALVTHWRWPFRFWAVIVAVLLLVAAFFTKVYFVLGAPSIFLSYALVHRDRGWTLRFAGLFASVFATALAVVLMWTHGLYWVFTFQMLSILIEHSTPLGLAYLVGFLLIYLPSWLLLAGALFQKRLDVRRYNVFFVHVLVATPATAMLLTNTGGASFYWYLVLPALMVVSVHLLDQETREDGSRLGLTMLTLTLVALIAAHRHGGIEPSQALARRWAPLRDKVAGADGPVMNSNLTAIVNIATGKKMYAEPVGFARNAAWLHDRYGYRFADPSQRIRERYYALLLDPESTAGLDDHYVLAEDLELPGQFGSPTRVRVYEPRRRQ